MKQNSTPKDTASTKKTIDTLVDDIFEVIKGNGGWDATVTKFLSEGIAGVAEARFSTADEKRTTIGLSSVGTPCKRKLWIRTNNTTGEVGDTDPRMLGTFFYGDLLEVLVLALAMAAGHRVEGMQTQLDVFGIKGHRDAVIDGVTVDVKSASKFSFNKFAEGRLRRDDPFGYISQLSSYVYGGKDDPLVEDKTHGAFLVVRKDRFDLCLDVHDFTNELKHKEEEIETLKATLAGPIPDVPYSDVPIGKSGNRGLCRECSHCQYMKMCWPRIRTFVYSDGPVHLTKVVRTPKVKELK